MTIRSATAYPFSGGVVAIAAMAILLGACSDPGSPASDEALPDIGSESGSDPTPDGDLGSDSNDDAGTADEDGSIGLGEDEPDLVVEPDEPDATEAEDPAEPPVVEADEVVLVPGDDDYVDDGSEPAPIGESLAVTCGALELGRDAEADGDSSRLRLVVETLGRGRADVADDELRAIVDGVVDGDTPEDGLARGYDRCIDLGYDSAF